MVDRRVRWGAVRVRTTIAATLVVGMALIVSGVVLIGLLRASLAGQVETAAELRAEDVAAHIGGGRPNPQQAVEDPMDSVIQILDRSGSVVAASANVTGRPPISDTPPGTASTVPDLRVGGDSQYRVVARSTPDGRYVVLAARSLEPVREGTHVVSVVLLIVVPVMLLLVAATTWIVIGRALRPVEAIRQQVAAISDEELSRRVPEPDGSDEIARLASTMNAMLERLEHSRNRQRSFVSDASHELRSPIATIRHQLEVAMAHPDGTSVGQLAPDLLTEGLRLERLVADLLLLALADEGGLVRHHRTVDLDDLVLAEAARLRQRGNVKVEAGCVSAGQVCGDAGQLGRLIRNLADNAERHAISVVTFSLRTANGKVTLTVADDGNGVPAADRSRIFERFTRLDDARSRDKGGTGLGLAIVADVARSHGGVVDLDCDGGARFTVVLPALDAG